MTKEEIYKNREYVLRKHYPDFDTESGWMFDGSVKSVFDAMDEYAKSQVIAYELWINEMLMDDSSFNYEKTPEQLYNLFLEHQLNNGG